MMKKKCFLFLTLVIILFPTNRLNAQVGMVVSVASKYMTLLQTKHNDVIFAHEEIENRLDEHSKIAIIPFISHISYAKPAVPTKEEAEQQFESQQMIGKMLQEQFWDVFDNYKSDVFLQDIRVTNKVLEDVGFFHHPDDFPPLYIAQLLQVDAVVLCTFDIHVDNTKTGWQNSSKALADVAMSSIKGSVPGLEALQFVKNPNAIINLVTKPGQFFTKLKNGDISELAQIAGGFLPEGPWQKVAQVASKNSNSIVKIAKGDTKNLLGDLIKDNASFIGAELKLDPQTINLIKNNSSSIQNVMQGNTKGLMYNLINDNVSSITQNYIGEQNTLLSNAINNNTTVFAKLTTGNTEGIMEEFLNKNLADAVKLVPGESLSMYSNLLVDNKEIVGKTIKGDFSGLTNQLLTQSTALLGEAIPEGDAQKYLGLLAEKEKINMLMQGDTQAIFATLTEKGTELFGDQIQNLDIQKFANLVGNNKEIISSIVDQDSNKILSSFVKVDTGLLGGSLNSDQVGNVMNLISSKGQSLGGILEGSANGMLGSWLSDIGLEGEKNKSFINNFSNSLLKDKELVQKVLKGDKNELLKSLGNQADVEQIDFILKNKAKFNELVGLANNEDFSLLGKSKEDLEVMSYQLMQNKSTLDGIMKGIPEEIYGSLNTNSEENNGFGIDQKLATKLSQGLASSQKDITTVMANAKINNLLLTDMIDLQFFEFANDALLEDYENVSLRKKTVSQTTASILDPTLDPKDSTKLSINIFDKNSDDLLWQYINQNSKARLYDMKNTLGAVVKRINKRFPYFAKYK